MNSSRSGTVLVVDDSPTMRGLIRLALTGGGFTVVEAASGPEALDRLAQHPVQAILTDVNMPQMDGISFVRSVRSDPKHRKTPILIVTTESAPQLKSAGKAAGATGWIVKPFEAEQLCAVVGMVIRRMAA
jgi:two-component system, chemotaxis family, chemotaxis protein CheY